jgi:hypothetical protein
VLLLKPGVHDRVTVGHVTPRPRVDHHLLGRLVHREQLAQIGESLLTRFLVIREQHVVEHVLDQVVLVTKEGHNIIGGLDKRFNHGKTSALFGK